MPGVVTYSGSTPQVSNRERKILGMRLTGQLSNPSVILAAALEGSLER